MLRKTIFVALSAIAASYASIAAGQTPAACDAGHFAALKLDKAVVTTANVVPAGAFTPAGATAALPNLPSFCLVAGEAMPSADSLIKFEVWVPQGAAWNGKLVVTGNGGYSPALSYGDMAYAMRQGYAAIGGDTGHQVADVNDMKWAVGHPEKIIDWGTRSINAITVPAKRIVAHLRGKDATRAYYYGCSTGGHQAYAEVQKYPQDFDGVIAGAPGNNRVALNAEFLWRFLANREQGTSNQILTKEKVQLVNDAALAACDARDGVKDGVIDDPRACAAHFNVDALQCKDGDAASCLSARELAVVRKIYAGPKNPRTHAQIYPGPVIGTEANWHTYWGTTEPVRAGFWRHWVWNNPWWNWWDFDFDNDMAIALKNTASMVDHNNPDIAAFKAKGGKLIAFQGWADPVVNAVDTIAYYDKVKSLQGSQAETDKFFRLFMVPGLDHCRGGPGVNVFGNGGLAAPNPGADNDLLSALDRWVEQGVAPERIVGARMTDGKVTRTRPLCAYPKRAVYNGSGSTDDASSFTCH
jgi:feruloyl esterase